MYTNRLEQFGIDTSKRLNSTHLKDRILAAIPDLEAHKQGRDVLLIFNEDIGKAIKQALASNYDDEAIILSKAAKIVRKDMMETNTSFKGFFETDCQKKSVPQSLKTLIGMILGGPNIETQSGNFIEAQCTLTIAQLLQFNFSVRRRKESSMQSSHSTDREPPLPTYLGLLIHAETRKRGLVDKLYDLGLSISYDRIMQLSTALGNSICESFNTENVVCPAKLRNGLFTTAAIDNIDHNPSSTTAQGSLHGTAISIFQHPVKEGDGFERLIPPIALSAARYEHLKPLPESYTVVPPVVLPKEKSEIPLLNGSLVADGTSISSALNLEYRWLKHVYDNVAADDTEDMEYSWAAFHANRLEGDSDTLLDITIDQAHEQNNKLVKGDGGAIGLTENMTQLQRWMVSGPEIARVINEFESAQERIKKDQSKGPDLRHHEQVKSRQDTFARQFDDESIWKEKDWRMGTRYNPNLQLDFALSLISIFMILVHRYTEKQIKVVFGSISRSLRWKHIAMFVKFLIQLILRADHVRGLLLYGYDHNHHAIHITSCRTLES
ncbi:Hypothetical predicted protein, partial [Mytilus galloprovincialis]